MKKNILFRLKRYSLKLNKWGCRWGMYRAVSLDRAIDLFVKDCYPHAISWERSMMYEYQLLHIYARWDDDNNLESRTFELKYIEQGLAI